MSTIALLPGDGIGAEVLDGPVAYLHALQRAGAPVHLTGPWPYGSTGWQQTGSVLPGETIEACRGADVVLSGAVGSHPGVDAADCPNPERALIELRHRFDLRVSVRTVQVRDTGSDAAESTDSQVVTVVRNIIGGAYGSSEQRTESDGTAPARDVLVLEPERIAEVVDLGLGHAVPGRRSISVDKASVYATSRLWRQVARARAQAAGIELDHVNVDRAAYELVRHEQLPAVIVTEGLFGDILSDVVCARAGSPAVCGSATINPDRVFGHGVTALFEPAHGSSPHRTGSRRSNPTGAWLALIELLAWCPDLAELGVHDQLRSALDQAIATGPATYDLAAPGAPTRTLDEFNESVLAAAEAGLAAPTCSRPA